MFPIKTFVSERRAANLLEQVRWRDGVYCPRCRGESMIRYGSYRVFQRYLCKDCDRTFNDQTGTIFEHSAVELKKWFLAVYMYIRFNTSVRLLDVEIDVSYKTSTDASSASYERWTRLDSISKVLLRSTNST
ncbi:transposase (ISH4) [Halorubrum tebenquichense DSM 14210]|uniref:Transposase (ISH4) n=1 Tax=Halorubrum tebenquichense DSM 14210 TaxID=1227485 RepID=M0DEC0_9EURY|nr:transposase (ISH4) [Halorubrum tebenquichense DSM 14210]